MSCVVITWTVLGCRVLRPYFDVSKAWCTREGIVITGIIVICSIFLLTREPYGFKVTMDELVLVATSMGMHFDRLSNAVMRGYEVQSVYSYFGGYVDKRPIFFPWILSILHDVLGYRPSNAYILNSGLTVVLLALTYRVTAWLSDWRCGVLAVLLLSSLPLLAQNATGAGFEILNAVMILVSVLAGAKYVRDPHSATQGLFLYSVVLLAHTRYESAVYILCAAMVIVGEWTLRRRIILTWPIIFAPLAVIPIAWTSRIFKVDPAFWQLPEGVSKPFDYQFFYENVGHFMSYLLDASLGSSNSPVLAVCSVFGLGFVILSYARRWGAYVTSNPDRLVYFSFVLGMFMNLAVVMFYHWGQVDKYEVSRLLIPFFVIGAISAASVLPEFSRRASVWWGSVATVLVSVYVFTLPATAKAVYTNSNYHARRMEWVWDFHKRLPEGNYFYITQAPAIFSINRVSALHISFASHRASQLKHHLDHGTFNEAFVVQNIYVNPDTGDEIPVPENEIGSNYKLEKIVQRYFRPYIVTRISRIATIEPVLDDSITNENPEEAVIHNPIETTPEYDAEEHYRKWMRQLP